MNTSGDVHYGLAAEKARDRHAVLATARAADPARFATMDPPKILDLPGQAWINQPATEEAAA